MYTVKFGTFEVTTNSKTDALAAAVSLAKDYRRVVVQVKSTGQIIWDYNNQ